MESRRRGPRARDVADVSSKGKGDLVSKAITSIYAVVASQQPTASITQVTENQRQSTHRKKGGGGNPVTGWSRMCCW
jgi:hypothetical protein